MKCDYYEELIYVIVGIILIHLRMMDEIKEPRICEAQIRFPI